MGEKNLYLDTDDQAKYLVENVGCSIDQAYLYIEGQDEYQVSIGISGYGTEDGVPALLNDPPKIVHRSSTGRFFIAIFSYH